MFVFGNLVYSAAYIIDMLLTIYFWVVIVRAVLSWIRPNPYNPLVRFIYGIVDPVTHRISRILPTRIGMFDIAPFLLILVIFFIQKFAVGTLLSLGERLR